MLARLRENYPGIAWHPGQSGKPGLFIEYLLKRIQVGSVSQKIKDQTGVNCPGTGAHRDPVQRCKSHRSVYASGSAHCGQRTPASQMAEDLTEILVTLATDNLSRSLAGVPKAGPMESVSDESFLNPVKRSGISSRSLGQRAMKAVSKSANCGTLLPRISRQAEIPTRLWGLWSGASSPSLSIVDSTCGFTSVARLNSRPP